MALIPRHGHLADSWWGATVPPTGPVGTANTWVGVDFGVDVPGRIAGFRRYDDTGFDGGAYGVLYDPVTNSVVRSGCWRGRSPMTSPGWHNFWFRPWYRVLTTQSYGLYVMFVGGHYFRWNSHLGGGLTQNNITFIDGFQSTTLYPFGFVTTNGNANGVDVLFQRDGP
jgi:hypothetical protein